MPRPYSSDLRLRVLKALDSGECFSYISKTFEISVKTIYLWRKQLENCGHLKTITGYQNGHSHKIRDLEDFKEFINKNNTLSLEELAQKFGNISSRTIYRAIQKLGYFRKKNMWIKKKCIRKKKKLNYGL